MEKCTGFVIQTVLSKWSVQFSRNASPSVSCPLYALQVPSEHLFAII